MAATDLHLDPYGPSACKPKLILAVFLCIGSLVACTREPPSVPTYDVIARVTDVLPGGEHRTFDFECRQGQALLVRAQQVNLDLTLQVADTRSVIASVDSAAERFGHETVVIHCRESSPHSVTLTHKQKDVPGGRFTLVIQELKGASAAELDAYEALAESGRLTLQQSWDAAIQQLAAAAEQWHNLGRLDEVAEARYLAAAVQYFRASQWQAAVANARMAHSIYSRLGNLEAREAAAILLGGALQEAAKGVLEQASADESRRWLDESEALLSWAGESAAKHGRGFVAAQARVYLAVTHYYRGNLHAAKRALEQGEQELAALHEEAYRKTALQNLATLLREQGAYSEAKAAFDKLLPLLGANDAYLRASTLHNSAGANLLLGYFDVALAQSLESLDLQKKTLRSKGGEARSLQRLGTIYLRLGQYARAIEFLERALPLARETDQGDAEFATLMMLGEVHRDVDNAARALELHRQAERSVRALREAGSMPSAGQNVLVSMALGADLVKLGRLPEALNRFRTAVTEASTPSMHHHLARALTQQARALLAMQRLANAHTAAEQAIMTARNNGNLPDEAAALTVKAQIDLGMQRDTAALASARQARAIYEKLRDRALSPRVRAAMLSSRRTAFDLQVELQARGGVKSEPAMLEALLLADSYHARSLLDALAATRLDGTGSAYQERTRLYDEVAGYDQALVDLLDQESVPVAKVATLRTQISSLLARIDVIEGRLNSQRTPSQLDAAALEALRGQLPENQRIVEFFVGSQHSWAWVLSRTSITTVQLPSEAVVRRLVNRARETLTKPTAHQVSEAAVRELSRAVITPLAKHLAGKQLLIVADGPLLYVPFQQLLEFAELGTTDHALLPSLSVLRMPPSKSTGKALRAALFSQLPAKPHAELPAAELETAAIAAVLGPNQVTAIRGATSSRAAFKSFAFQGYDVVHIASHAVNNPIDASLSQLLIGNTANDVLLASDINLLRIPVPLVVLSGCETALGTDLTGNGVGGFAQAFMAAGAQSVIASLWNIPDAAAAELMKHFYAAFNDDPSPQRALALAQSALRQGSQWSHPFYWSGFVVITRSLK